MDTHRLPRPLLYHILSTILSLVLSDIKVLNVCNSLSRALLQAYEQSRNEPQMLNTFFKEIEKQGPLIEKARQEGRCGASYNGVRLPCQVEDLLTQLEQDKRLIIQQLTIQGTDQKTINELRKTFKEKWENIRRSLELAKLRSGVEIYQTIAKRVDWDYMASKLKKSFNHLNSTISSYEKSRNVCQKIHPSKKNWRQCVSLYFGGKSE